MSSTNCFIGDAAVCPTVSSSVASLFLVLFAELLTGMGLGGLLGCGLSLPKCSWPRYTSLTEHSFSNSSRLSGAGCSIVDQSLFEVTTGVCLRCKALNDNNQSLSQYILPLASCLPSLRKLYSAFQGTTCYALNGSLSFLQYVQIILHKPQ